ncbi:MAG: M24 family metallopeptidase [Chloroflexi bacterium]|nr:M24 family metallopeptidase [Chloroflexota bacterium]
MLQYRPMPTYLTHTAPSAIPAAVYEARLDALYSAAGCDWVVIYGDREHAADITFLSNFDPRFEEAIVVIGPQRAIIVGNEGVGYVSMLGPNLPHYLSQSLGLMGQDRTQQPKLSAVLRQIGLRDGATVGVVGWKYLEPSERDSDEPAFVPAMLLSAIRAACNGTCRLLDVTHHMTHPSTGLRSRNDAHQIRQFAWGSQRASLMVDRIVRGARPGMSEYQAAVSMQYTGDPLACHSMMSGSQTHVIGLRSPSARQLELNDAVTTAIGLRGGLCCRAGVLAETVSAHFLTEYVAPYMRTQKAWYEALGIGVQGGHIHQVVMQSLAGAPFVPSLNPGHLGSIDEWCHTPIRPGSTDVLVSGALIQCDIIPTETPSGTALNCEDAVVLADAGLRAELAALDPELWQVIQARRAYMRDALGIQLANEVLPISLANARYAPAWLQPDVVWITS